MSQPMSCGHCGANLALEDMKRPNCPYCGTVLPHHARAAEHAALVNKVLEQRIGAQYPGMPPGQIPQIGHHFGAPMQGLEAFQHRQVDQAVRRAGWAVAVAVIVPVVLLVVVGMAAGLWMFLAR